MIAAHANTRAPFEADFSTPVSVRPLFGKPGRLGGGNGGLELFDQGSPRRQVQFKGHPGPVPSS